MVYPNFKIVFIEPDITHPKSKEVSVSEVAKFLEKKYKICQTFTAYIKTELLTKILKSLLNGKEKKFEREKFKIEQWLQAEWRDFIVTDKTGIRTKIAQEEDRVSFIDTGAYYLSMQIKIE